MSQPLIVPLPRNLVLPGGYTISVDALDPTSGASVAGVKISNVTIQVDQVSGEAGPLPPLVLVRAGS